MKGSVCPYCKAPVGVGTYFSTFWLTHIRCPSCKRRVKVEGLAGFYALSLPPSVLCGLMARPIRLEHGIQPVLFMFAGLVVALSVLLIIGLMTWLKLGPEDPS